jgi:nucleoside-diphosphate-sugar epimerase
MGYNKVFVTGATGFIGGHVVEALLNAGYYVECLIRDHLKAKFLKNLGATLVKGDLSGFSTWKTSLRDCDAIIHCAAFRGERAIGWERYYEVNTLATMKLLEVALQYNIPKFIFISSVGVYGTSPKQLPANEETIYNPDSNYHKSKMLAEQAILRLASREESNTKVTIFRPTITYGPRDTGFLYNILRYVKKGVFPIIGNGKNFIHLLYIDGLIKAILKDMESYQRRKVSIYNIADKEPITYRDILFVIREVLNRPIRVVRVPRLPLLLIARFHDHVLAPLYRGASMTISLKIASLPWYYDISKAVKELGYEPYETITALRKTIHWYQEGGFI